MLLKSALIRRKSELISSKKRWSALMFFVFRESALKNVKSLKQRCLALIISWNSTREFFWTYRQFLLAKKFRNVALDQIFGICLEKLSWRLSKFFVQKVNFDEHMHKVGTYSSIVDADWLHMMRSQLSKKMNPTFSDFLRQPLAQKTIRFQKTIGIFLSIKVNSRCSGELVDSVYYCSTICLGDFAANIWPKSWTRRPATTGIFSALQVF